MLQQAPQMDLSDLPDGASQEIFQRARQVFPDGTTRATVERDPVPRYIARGEGAYLVDVDGNRFLDLNNNFTTLIHGHGFAPVVDAVTRVLRDGSCFSNPTAHEVDLAELLGDRIPAAEQVRFVNTGTEAVMFAIKAARALTGRPGVARIEGAYHGSYDWAEAGQGGTPASWGDPDDPLPVAAYAGMPLSVTDEVLPLRLNDTEGARKRLAASADRIACLLIDPMPSRAGLIAPDPAFIDAVVETARANGILVICDEVLNLRQGYRGASARYGIRPDLIAMGKIIGGGFPIGAIGGSRKAMRVFDRSSGKAMLNQAGTFSANPISMVAGFVSMQALTQAEFVRLDAMGNRLREGLGEAIKVRQVPYSVTGAASLFRIHPKRREPRDFREAFMTPAEASLMHEMSRFFLAEGILLPEGAAGCLSTAMQNDEVDRIISVFARFLELAPTSSAESAQ